MIKGGIRMEPKFLRAEEVAQELSVSKPYAYNLIRQLNEELKSKEFITISGRINREYFNERLYEYHSLQYSARWGLLFPESCALAKKAVIEKTDISDIPLILHHRTGLQQEIAHWAQTEVERLHITATYNIVNGDPAAFVQSGLGYLLTTDDHLPKQLEHGLCFRPLYPALEIRLALVWKRYTVFSKSAEVFLGD